MSVRYREHAPAAGLAHLVRCYWTSRGTADAGTPAANRVLPDGCMDVLFDLHAEKHSALAVGAMLQAAVYRHGPDVDLLGVRFVPGAGALFLRTPAAELTDLVVDATALWQDLAALTDVLRETSDQGARIRHLDDYLLKRLNTIVLRPAALAGMALIERARGQIRITDICRALNTTERSLQRLFAQEVGLTPKQAVRVMRFRHALQIMHTRAHTSLAQVAFSAGYADQAHFTREFHDLAAIAPTIYVRERSLVGFVQDEAGAAD